MFIAIKLIIVTYYCLHSINKRYPTSNKMNPERSDRERVSRFMAKFLRHLMKKRKVNCDGHGFVSMDDLLKQPEMKGVTPAEVEDLVKNNPKQRFSLREDNNVFYVRANQGHSKEVGSDLDDALALTPLFEALPVCVHGTTEEAWKQVEKTGLKPMGRKHVHFATGLPNEGVVSGMRASSVVLVFVDMQMALNKGKKFFMSKNGVVLTPDVVEPEFFYEVWVN